MFNILVYGHQLVISTTHMRKVLSLIVFTIVVVTSGFSQDMTHLDSTMKENLKKEEQRIRSELKTAYEKQPGEMNALIEFSVDTFLIEKELELKMAHVKNLFSRELALNDAVYAYNRLVGKYMDLLNTFLEESDQKVLQSSQLSWLDYKREEFKFLENIAHDPYPDGKTVDNLYITRRLKEINKSRAGELFSYCLLQNSKSYKK